MKTYVILLLTTLLTTITSFSQNISTPETVLITTEQLKKANLVFIEHDKLLKENLLLYNQIYNYKEYTNTLLKTDSVKELKLEQYQIIMNTYDTQINNLTDDIKRKNRTIKIWKIGGITISAGLLLLFLIK